MAKDFDVELNVNPMMEDALRQGAPEWMARSLVMDATLLRIGDRRLRRRIKELRSAGGTGFLPEDVEFRTDEVKFPEIGWVRAQGAGEIERDRLRMVYLIPDKRTGDRKLVCDYWPK
jgi:hypothetical protein